MVENIGTIHPININEEMRGSFLDYAMSVIVSRALPDARDGLKPVHRRILYAMYDMGIRANTGYKKSARIVGEVLGKYHPHGDSSVYDAMSRMVQTFSLRYPLVDGQGNFGSIDGDSPAAMRYTEARMAQLTEEMLADIDMNTVDFGDNFDGTLLEPLVLPARLPNMLLNGTSGIAVGMATNIPPHNLRELSNAIAFMIENWDQLEEISVDDLMRFVTGPDFPTGATVVAGDEMKEAYATGRGRVIVRAKAEVEEGRNGRPHLVITEIPYQISKTSIIERIVALVREDRIKHIADLRDESDRQGMRLVIELKPGSQPMKVLNQLYKYTQLQSTFGIQMLALVNNEPRTLSLKRMLQIYIEHRFEVITRRSQFELEKRRARAHILNGLMKALDSIDAIIQTIRAAEDTEGARNALMSRFDLSDLQANAILEMQLRRLAALERQKLMDEYNEVMARIAYLEDLLASPYKILGLIRDDVLQLATDYGDVRRTEVAYGIRTDFQESDLVRDEEVVILLTKHGYIKRVPTSAYTAQHRGGKGVTGMVTREEDGVVQLVAANSLDTIMFFTNRGKVYSERCYVVPEGARAAKGTLVHIFLGLESDEQITAIVPVSDFDEGYFVLATKLGRIKRVRKSEFEDVRATGKIAIALDEGDTLNWVRPSNGEQNVILATVDGQSIRFDEDRVRVLGRQAAGVNSMRLAEGDTITGMDVIEEGDTHVLVVTANGYGKRTSIEEYRVQGRYGSGIRTLSRNEKTGPIIAMNCINPKDDILLITSSNQILRTWLGDIRDTGRSAMGVRLVDLGKRNKIVGMAILDGSLTEGDADENGDLDGIGDLSEDHLNGVNGSDAELPQMNGSHDVDDDEDEGEE